MLDSNIASGTLERPEQLLELARRCTDELSSGPWYRGHADDSWTLVPKVARPALLAGRERQSFEDSLVHDFRRRAIDALGESGAARGWPDWLALMQHLGLPTRLLDWSSSILIAAFFAVHEHTAPDRDGALWVLDPAALAEQELGRRAILTPDDLAGKLACMLPFEDLAFGARGLHGSLMPRLEAGIVPLEPHATFARMMIQQSRFTVHGRSSALEQGPGAAGYLRGYRIPAECKPALAQALAGLGIRLTTVFPDIEHLALELRELAALKGDDGSRLSA